MFKEKGKVSIIIRFQFDLSSKKEKPTFNIHVNSTDLSGSLHMYHFLALSPAYHFYYKIYCFSSTYIPCFDRKQYWKPLWSENLVGLKLV